MSRQVIQERFAFWLVREFLTSEDEQFTNLEPISNKEFYSVLGLLIAGVAVLALTIGPFAIV